MMKTAQYVCVALAALFLVGAVLAFVVRFDEIENTTPVLAGAAIASAFLAWACRLRQRSHR